MSYSLDRRCSVCNEYHWSIRYSSEEETPDHLKCKPCLVKERDEARRLAEEWRDWAEDNFDTSGQARTKIPGGGNFYGRWSLPWEVEK